MGVTMMNVAMMSKVTVLMSVTIWSRSVTMMLYVVKV